jgi:hypothetical protein
MRALVVYESMFGNTRKVAESVAAGLGTALEQVEVRAVADADVVSVLAADLVLVGGPTHAHAMSRPKTRKAAVDEPARYSAAGTVEPGAGGIGLREWFAGVPASTGRAAAFDTRADAPAPLTGRASRGIAQRLRRNGLTLVDRPQSFVVTKTAELKDGELDRAQEWGRTLARALSAAAPDGRPVG